MRVLILLALLGAAVALPRKGQRIIGGEPTDVESYTFMSNMQYSSLGIVWSHACGGSLITEYSVLSAAHCYYGDTPSVWRVLLGTSLASSGGSEHRVSELVVHPAYSENDENDLAIVRLAVPAILSDTVNLAGIPGANYYLDDGEVVSLIGWGSLTYPNVSFTEQLQRVDINIINQEYCIQQYDSLRPLPGFEDLPDITDNSLCAGIQHIGGKDGCSGDSGGPLVHMYFVVVGIHSWANHCADPDYPGVNVRVSRYTEWIVLNA